MRPQHPLCFLQLQHVIKVCIPGSWGLTVPLFCMVATNIFSHWWATLVALLQVNTMWIGITMMARIISDLCWALIGTIISLNIIIQFQLIISSQPASKKEPPYLHQEGLCWSGNMSVALFFSLPQCTCLDPLVQLNLTNASRHNWCQEKSPISYKCS